MTDSTSLETIWARFSDELRAWFARRGAGVDADDLLQETALRVTRNLASLRTDEKLGPWLRRIARNVWIDHLRARNDVVGLDEDAEPREAEVADDALDGLVASWLRPMLERLEPGERAVLQAHEFDGRPIAEIASELELSTSAVKSRLQRGRAKLRAVLLSCCRFTFDARGQITAYEQHEDRCEPCGPDC